MLRSIRSASSQRQIRAVKRFFSSQNSDDTGPTPKTTEKNPLSKTLGVLKNDFSKIGRSLIPGLMKNVDFKEIDSNFQTHCDVLIIGGGGVGSSIAYWLKSRARNGLNVVVVEKDNTYSQASTSLSVGGVRQQFSVEENIEMSLYAADFLRNIKEHLGDEIDVNFTPHGYLMLASEEGAETLMKNSTLQNQMGAKNKILTANKLKSRFPWINTEGIAVGCLGLEKEGWFDPWSLLQGFKKRSIEYGAHYTNAEVVGFEYKVHHDFLMEGLSSDELYNGIKAVQVKMPTGEIKTINFGVCVIAGGAASGEISKMANIGVGPGMLSIPLPVEPRKRFVYVFSCDKDNGPGIETPLTIDPNNTYFRRDGLGGNYIAGRSPSFEEEPSTNNLDVDYDYFQTHVWPSLAHRVPSFEGIKVHNAWAGFYEYNTFDENGIIGPHPYYHNLYIATGFSGHGIQQTPAVGRAIAELIIDGDYQTIDLTRFGFDRIIVNQPMYETNIV